MSNIYLNEFDRLMKHHFKPLAYLRYGDDWLCFASSKAEIESVRIESTEFLKNNLSFTINPKLDSIKPAHQGVSYLGVDIWPNGRRLKLEVRSRIVERLDISNAESYRALVTKHENGKRLKNFNWRLLDIQ